MEARRAMTLNLTEREMDVLADLAAQKGLSKTAVLRQALRIYQLIDARMTAGERMSFSGDASKIEVIVV